MMNQVHGGPVIDGRGQAPEEALRRFQSRRVAGGTERLRAEAKGGAGDHQGLPVSSTSCSILMLITVLDEYAYRGLCAAVFYYMESNAR